MNMTYKKYGSSNKPDSTNKNIYISFRQKIFICVVLTFLFAHIGTVLYNYINNLIPTDIQNRLLNKYLIFNETTSKIHFIWSIICNSVDIFKIMIIIIISGFTYIPDIIIKLLSIYYGLYNGFLISMCFDHIARGAFSIHSAYLYYAIIAITFFIFFLIYFNCCAKAQKSSVKFRSYDSPVQIITSAHFWKYMGTSLISFGYIIVTHTASRLLLLILY